VLHAGKLSDTRQRFLGTRAPRLFAVWVRGVRSLLALSSRPWLGYTDMGRWQFMPLSYETLDHAAVRSAPCSMRCYLGLLLCYQGWMCACWSCADVPQKLLGVKASCSSSSTRSVPLSSAALHLLVLFCCALPAELCQRAVP
jgi:hypothetical protein